MTSDLYDQAKPIRNAAMAEVERCLARNDAADPDPVDPAIVDGHRLGTHLQALVVAFCADRYKTFKSGMVADDPIDDIMAIAVAQVAAHMAVTVRPTVGGRPVSPTASGQIFMQRVTQMCFEQLVLLEHGLQDFNVSFQRRDDGSVEVEPFDLDAMLAKGRGK